MTPLVVLVVAAIAALVIWLAVLAYRQEKARVAELANLALAKQWQFSAEDPYDLPERWEGAPFGRGYDRHARNVLTGAVEGHPMIAFDYSYKEDSSEGSGNRSTTTHHFAICALAMPCPLPEVRVEPEGFLGRISTMLGTQDVELESEDFNRRFRVRCPDPKVAVDVLTPRTMQVLLDAGRVHLRTGGGDLMQYEDGSLTAADLLNRTGLLARVLAGVPEFVWKDHRA